MISYKGYHQGLDTLQTNTTEWTKFSLNSWCIVKVNELIINLDVIFDKEIITFGFERMQGVFQVTLALP